jgi:hypothetical protein
MVRPGNLTPHQVSVIEYPDHMANRGLVSGLEPDTAQSPSLNFNIEIVSSRSLDLAQSF